MMIDFDALLPELPDSEPYTIEGVAGVATIVLRPLERSERSLIVAALRSEAQDPPPEFNRETATEADLAAMSLYQARQLAHRVVRLEIDGVDRTADAPAFLAAYADRRPLGFASLLTFAHRPETYGKAAPIDAEGIAGNS